MTLIIGLNLSDRIYLGADTRITFGNGSYKDDVLKISALGEWENTLHAPYGLKRKLLLSVAGNVNLASFLFGKISPAIRGKDLATDVRRLHARIESFLKPGTIIIIDGRTSNYRFLLNNLQRNWVAIENFKHDQYFLILDERPLGRLNREQIKFHYST